MKILWVSASAVGPASRILEQKYAGSSGVWIQSIYEELMNSGKDCKMYFLCFSKSVPLTSCIHKSSDEGEAYCLNMPKVSLGRSAPKKLKQSVEKVISEIAPDIIHIWGTETCVQNVVADCAPSIPKVVFLQGIIGIHDRYHNMSMKKLGLSCKKNISELLRDSVHNHLFHEQAKFEKVEISKCNNVITDILISEAYCASIDPKIKIHRYPLNPNSVFVINKWNLHKCEKNSVFTVYGASQDKGLHQLLLALPIVKQSVPDVKLYIPGRFHIDETGHLLQSGKIPSYERLLRKIITEHDLNDNVIFCGQLSQNEMAERLSQANVFVNPSVMETHAGSLREAMSVGTPVISSYCGSVGELVAEGVSGLLYRYEEYEVLAYKLSDLLCNDELCTHLSTNEVQKMDSLRSETNMSLTDIYSSIINMS